MKTGRSAIVNRDQAGLRLDVFLVRRFVDSLELPELSRSGMQRMIAEGQVTVNGHKSKPGFRLRAGDAIEIYWSPPRESGLIAEALPLNILYEDEDCIVINKAPGVIVHPVPGRSRGTLVNALLYHCPSLAGINGERRPGIVHRLDKDTSGAMVVAKHDLAFHDLARQFKDRQVLKEYVALVWGKMEPAQGSIDRPIGRHRSDRKRMSSVRFLSRKREAVTEWAVEGLFPVGAGKSHLAWITLARLRPRTGRTHQIRVHLADQGYPIVGDKIYGWKRRSFSAAEISVPGLLDFPRQALHAEKLVFYHPRSGAAMEFQAPMFDDMKKLLADLMGRCSIGESGIVVKGVDKKIAFS